ncbi:MAG TPA: hypothetical protein VFV41_16340 [Streptosporangiaceae bacterium]|nr:hypothetical protein [Streptosporangiaceae bacterium]
MAAIEVFALLAAVGFGLVGLLTILVIVGVHQEERRWTLGRPAPTAPAMLARRVLGTSYPAGWLDRPPADDLIGAGRADDLVSR